MFNCILIDGARLLTCDKLLQQRLNLSANSLLADFYAKLKEDYGLYGMYVTDISSNKSDVYGYMDDGNLLTDLTTLSYGKDYRQLDLFKYDIKNLKINYGGVMSDREVMTEQINGIMKYKTPANALEFIMDKVGMFSSSADGADVYSMYKEACSLKEQASKLVAELKLSVEVDPYSGVYSVNSWEKHGKNFYDIQVGIINTAPYIVDKKGVVSIKPGVTAFEVIMTTLEQYMSSNEKAMSKIREIDDLCDEIEEKLREFDEWLENNELENEIDVAYSNMLSKEVSGLKTFVSRVSYTSEMEQLNKNIECFTAAKNCCVNGIAYLNNTNGKIPNMSNVKEYTKEMEILNNVKSNFSINSYDMTADESLANYDKSDQKERALAKVFNSDDDIVISDEKYKSLPSVENKESDSSVISGLFDSLSTWSSKDSDAADIGGFLPAIKSIGKDVMNSVYLNDYIMTYFYCANDSSMSRDSLFEAEIEYIIAGNKSQNQNITEVSEQLLSVRFVMNFMHVVTDEKKMNFANEIGTAISSATYGIGAPVYAFIIMSTWALTESAIDVNNLLRGESVPLFKSAGDWKLDIGLKNIGSVFLEAIGDSQTENSVTSKDSVLNMDYNDYLRLLLMFVSDDTKLMRVCDLIQLNLSFDHDDEFLLSDVYTNVVCDCTVRLKALVNDKNKKGRVYEMFFRSDAAY